MPLYPRFQPVDYSRYAPDREVLEAYYGLPERVAFCRSCVISNQRPNSAVEFRHNRDSKKATIRLDDEGICDACRVAEAKKGSIDWEQRADQLADLCNKFRRNDGKYDCLVPGSGGKDSFFAAHVLRHRYGMHPMTVTWAPHIHTDWGWRNFQSWIHAGFDNYLMTPNGRVHRLLTRLAVENLLHPFQAFMLGQKNLAPKMALHFGLPLVFYGENEAEYGNPVGDTASAKRDWAYFTAADKSEIYLGGVSIADLTAKFGVDPAELQPYLPADPARIAAENVEVHYL